jgi:hypothetical protein
MICSWVQSSFTIRPAYTNEPMRAVPETACSLESLEIQNLMGFVADDAQGLNRKMILRSLFALL